MPSAAIWIGPLKIACPVKSTLLSKDGAEGRGVHKFRRSAVAQDRTHFLGVTLAGSVRDVESGTRVSG
jgi:hypothetical protein